MKTCTSCNETKDLSAFSKQKRAKCGYQPRCKKCFNLWYTGYSKSAKAKSLARARVKKYANTEKGKINQRRHDRSEQKKLRMSAYRKSDAGIATRKREQARLARLKRHLIYSPVRRKLTKQPCERCGTLDRVQAHHEDYSKPLEVKWFCPSHHAQRHKEIRLEAMATT